MVNTVLTQDLIEISMQSNENLDVLYSLVKEDFATKDNLKANHIFTLICELIWVNSSILLVLRKDFQDLTFKDDSQKEMLIADETLQALTTLVLARWQASSELNRFSYSLSLH
tara:strand:+ start:28 stop:366 length:339 start_codon:yes stop_codon:yes gene_type:complete